MLKSLVSEKLNFVLGIYVFWISSWPHSCDMSNSLHRIVGHAGLHAISMSPIQGPHPSRDTFLAQLRQNCAGSSTIMTPLNAAKYASFFSLASGASFMA